MTRLLLIGCIALSLSVTVPTDAPLTGRDIVKQMHDRYSGKWYHSFTFTQTTEVYRNDSLRSTQTWHEFIRLPDRFRMDFGAQDSGNAVIFRGDSAYRFRNGKLRSIMINNNEGLIFLLGGMYFYPLDQTCRVLTDSLHYDLGPVRVDNWQGHPVYIIGKEDGNQLWVDRQNLCILRMFKVDGRQQMDARFEDWKPYGGGLSETKCRFYINGKLIQVETYYDCKANITLEDKIFDPAQLNRSW